MGLSKRWLSALTCAGALATPAVMHAEDGASAVKALASAMTERQLDAIAAADPEKPGRYIAALLIPGAQLLVVAAEYPNPAELQALLTPQGYRDVYSALHQPAASATRLFFLDAGCDGMQVGRDAVDVLYEKGTSELIFDGDWKKAKLSQSQYDRRVEEAGEQFGHLVTVLRNSLPVTTAAR